MLNMGGPATLEEVEPFLTRLFTDKDIIPLPAQRFPFFLFLIAITVLQEWLFFVSNDIKYFFSFSVLCFMIRIL